MKPYRQMTPWPRPSLSARLLVGSAAILLIATACSPSQPEASVDTTVAAVATTSDTIAQQPATTPESSTTQPTTTIAGTTSTSSASPTTTIAGTTSTSSAGPASTPTTTTQQPSTTTKDTQAGTTPSTVPAPTSTTLPAPDNNRQPTIGITSPGNLSSHVAAFDPGSGGFRAVVSMSANATDPDGDPVTIDWFSSLSGYLGTGEFITASLTTLSDSSQPYITARATDPFGATSETTIQLIVWVPSDT